MPIGSPEIPDFATIQHPPALYTFCEGKGCIFTVLSVKQLDATHYGVLGIAQGKGYGTGTVQCDKDVTAHEVLRLAPLAEGEKIPVATVLAAE